MSVIFSQPVPACLSSWWSPHRTCWDRRCACERRPYTTCQVLVQRRRRCPRPVPRCEDGSSDDCEAPAPGSRLRQALSASQQRPASATKREILHTKKNIETHSLDSAASWVKKLGWAISCNFPTDSRKFCDRGDYGCSKFHFCRRIPLKSQNGDCQPQILYFCKKVFRHKQNFLTTKNLEGRLPPAPPPATTPLYGFTRILSPRVITPWRLYLVDFYDNFSAVVLNKQRLPHFILPGLSCKYLNATRRCLQTFSYSVTRR